MITFEQARAAVAAVNEPAWEDDHMPGTYMVAGYGWEDAGAFLVIDGAKEFLVDGNDEYEVMDAPAVFVDKATGTVMEAVFLEVQDRIMAMAPVGNHPAQD
jgi:hypothetical protein